MNREIKFRRPHFRHNDLGFDQFTIWGPNGRGFVSPSSISYCYYKEGTDQQYIELKDRNSRDIFEGDIVQYAVKNKTCPDCASREVHVDLKYSISKFCPECGNRLTDSDFIEICEVVFSKGGFAYKRNVKEGYYQSWAVYVAEVYIEWVEVIGNIYENPELLKA